MKPRVALCVNLIAPYRIPVYRRLAESFHLRVLISGKEDNRPEWNGLQEEVGREADFEIRRVWGVSVKRRVRDKEEGAFDFQYTHVNPGYLPALLRFRPSLIISLELGIRTILSLIAGKLLRVPVWVWWGGTPHTERNRGRLRRALRTLLRSHVDRWITYGHAATEYLEGIGVSRSEVLQIQNSVDETVFAAARENASPDSALSGLPRPRLLVVGQLIRRKGIVPLLEAIEALQKEDGLEFSTVFVGRGPERDWIERRVQSASLWHVELVGSRTPKEMPGVYAGADWLVFPTLEDVWGLVVNEALWAGLPVVASSRAGCARELLPSRCIFDPADPESLRSVLRSALRGELEPPSEDRLLPSRTVGDRIVRAIWNTFASEQEAKREEVEA